MTSLLQPHNVSMRQGEKDMEVFDLDDLFDEYVGTDLLQFSDSTAGPSSSDDLAHLFVLPASNESDPVETSPMPDWDTTTDDAWRKAPLPREQSPASPAIPSNSFSVYPKSRGKASLSDSEIFNLDDLFDLDQPETKLSLSTPSTPKSQDARPAKKADSTSERISRNGIQKSTKKSSTFAKMMRPSHFRSGFQELWTRRLDTPQDAFNLNGLHHANPTTPPASTKLIQDEHTNGFFSRDQPYTITMSPLTTDSTQDMHHSNYQLTPLSSPAIDTNSRNNAAANPFQFPNDNMAAACASHQNHNAALSALQTPPPTTRLSMTTWGPDTPSSLEFTFPTSPEFQPIQGKGWWNNGASHQPTTPTYHTTNARSQRPNLSFSSASVAGLGISCDSAPFSSFGPELHTASSNGHTTPASGFVPVTSPLEMGYTPTATPVIYPQSNGIHIGHPLASPPSRSSSQSPQPRFTRRRHSSQHTTTRSAHRRKSSHQPTSSHQKSASVGFVNFTPDDSRKILTGVAPSGSSKTKARREKEAAERRRKLSQAAVKAVIDAGGDLSRLEENGLLSLGVEDGLSS